jgi:hypothetical protein
MYDGGAGRNVLRDREEHILANMGVSYQLGLTLTSTQYTNADHMTMITWNRFGHEHGYDDATSHRILQLMY